MILESLMVANAAFAVIKQTLANGKDIMDAGEAASKYFKAENDIAKEVEAKGRHSALEAYQAQQQLRKQEDELKYLLNKQGLLGYANFVQFRAEWSREQKEQAKLAARRKYQRAKALEENISIGLKVGGTLLLIMGALFGVAIYLR
tara:strand:- start:1200 stop:1637 length:438 start_codon:yes stop_codon:yes gene_type:complete